MENSTICIRQTKGFPNFCCTSLVRVEEYWEIVLHLIYRTNIGVSHNVVGRKKGQYVCNRFGIVESWR